MIMVGTGVDTKKFIKQVKKLGLEKEILFVGKITDTREKSLIFARIDLFLFPSYYDTDGLVKYEAACFNTPVASVKEFYTASNLLDNHNAYLSDNSVQDFAKRVVEAMSDDEIYKEVSQNCYKDLYRTWGQSAEKIYHDYLKLIEDKKEKPIK